MITREEVMEQLHYDEFSGVLTWKVKVANRVKVGDEAGHIWFNAKGKPYRQTCIKGKRYYAHRLAWLLLTGSFPEHEIDHIDGNGLNNKAENLRAVSHAENCKNVRKRADNTSGVTGVTWCKDRSKWFAQMRINGSQVNIGYFADKNDAIAARKAGEMKYRFHPNHGSERAL